MSLHSILLEGENIDEVRLHLNKECELEEVNSEGETPLCFAVTKGYLETTSMLLEHGANVNAKDNKGYTPLHKAALHGQTEIVSVLLNNGANVNEIDDNGETPLHTASSNSEAEIILSLLKHGANVNAKGNRGQTPLHFAGMFGDADQKIATIEKLISAGAEIDARDHNEATPLLYEAGSDNLEKIRILLDHGANIESDNNGMTPLYKAVWSGRDVPIIKLLIERGADLFANVDDSKRNALHHALHIDAGTPPELGIDALMSQRDYMPERIDKKMIIVNILCEAMAKPQKKKKTTKKVIETEVNTTSRKWWQFWR